MCSSGCGKRVSGSFRCPECVKNNMPAPYYCDGDCFHQDWPLHAALFHRQDYDVISHGRQQSKYGMCSRFGCSNPASKAQCRMCFDNNLTPTHYCSQDCAVLSYDEHFKSVHSSENNSNSSHDMHKPKSKRRSEKWSKYGMCSRSPLCDKPATKAQCRLCFDLNLPPTYFCSEDCAEIAWDSHSREKHPNLFPSDPVNSAYVAPASPTLSNSGTDKLLSPHPCIFAIQT